MSITECNLCTVGPFSVEPLKLGSWNLRAYMYEKLHPHDSAICAARTSVFCRKGANCSERVHVIVGGGDERAGAERAAAEAGGARRARARARARTRQPGPYSLAMALLVAPAPPDYVFH